MITGHWCTNNNVHVLETFSDEGYTARNFDRPDMVKLRATIKSLKIKPDYLVVAELTRFSRQLGDGVKVVEEIQQQWLVDKQFTPAMQEQDRDKLTKGWHKAINDTIAMTT